MRSVSIRIVLFLGTLILLMSACSEMQQVVQQLRPVAPRVQLKGMQLSQLSFEGATIDFHFGIHNPNPFTLSLAGFDYAVEVLDNHPLVKGVHRQPTSIPARGDSSFTLPISFTFRELYGIIQSAGQQDSIPYTFRANFQVEVPVLGTVSIPVTRRGTLPLIRPPRLAIRGLQVDQLNWQGARLLLKLAVNNPNSFDLALRRLDYRIQLQEQTVATGNADQRVTAPAHQEAVLAIPIQLNFLELGVGLYRLLTGSSSIPVSLNGQAVVGTPLPLLKQATIPIRLNTTVSLNQ